ncbi:OTU-domain-containing protein [Paxillus ammoniavirescens]|nr:OTU-domain-containing protein [Paxillus ammoniavirescens]
MAPVRVRHPKGVTTLQLDFDVLTVQDLQQQIFGVSEIPPSQQEIKSGYPPQTLTLIPELPLSSLGLKAGEQIIVNRTVSSPSRGPPPSTASRAPPAPARQPAARPTNTGPASVPTSSGVLVHRVVPDDNSCLFSSVALIFEQDITKAQKIRQIVADGIREDMETYNEAILGAPRDNYIATILKPSTWGGAIELGILAKHFNTEIASIDVETGRIDQFSPSPQESRGYRCLLVYSGIHYDAATLAPTVDAQDEWHQSIFPITSAGTSDPVLEAAKELATILRERRAFTNTATFDLKCEQCGKGLKGEKDARAHAQETGHVRFGEY